MTTVKLLTAVMEYDEGDVSIRLIGAFEEIREVAWDEKFLLTIGRDRGDIVISISLPNNACSGLAPESAQDDSVGSGASH